MIDAWLPVLAAVAVIAALLGTAGAAGWLRRQRIEERDAGWHEGFESAWRLAQQTARRWARPRHGGQGR